MTFALAALLTLPLGQVDPVIEDRVNLGDYATCGVTSLYLIAKMHKSNITWQQLKDAAGPAAADGTHSFDELARAAQTAGLHVVGLELGRTDLERLPLPAIVQVIPAKRSAKTPHLLVLLSTHSGGVEVLDAPNPRYTATWAGFERAWTGKALLVTPDPALASSWQQHGATTGIFRPLGPLWLGLGILSAVSWFSWKSGPSFVSTIRRVGWTWTTIAACGTGAVVLAGYGVWTWANPHPPTCELNGEAVNLGEFALGAHVVDLPIRNTGGQPLQIRKISSTCSCAVAELPPEIAPGSEGVIKVKIDVTPGPRNAWLLIESNAPNSPVRVGLDWFGPAKFATLPPFVNSAALLGKPYERRIRVIYPGGKDVPMPRFEGFSCPLPGVQLRPVKNDAEATAITQAGVLTDTQGELELHLQIPSPEKPMLLHTVCQIKLAYGNTTQTIKLSINIDFRNPTVQP